MPKPSACWSFGEMGCTYGAFLLSAVSARYVARAWLGIRLRLRHPGTRQEKYPQNPNQWRLGVWGSQGQLYMLTEAALNLPSSPLTCSSPMGFFFMFTPRLLRREPVSKKCW